MLRKLTKKQVSEHWSELKPAVVKAFPRMPKDIDLWMNTLLEKLLKGEGDAWVGLDEKDQIVFVCITLYIHDPCGLEKHLMVYTLYGYSLIPQNLWDETPKVLIKFARDKGCSAVVAYSDVPRVKEMCKKYGGNTDMSYITWRI